MQQCTVSARCLNQHTLALVALLNTQSSELMTPIYHNVVILISFHWVTNKSWNVHKIRLLSHVTAMFGMTTAVIGIQNHTCTHRWEWWRPHNVFQGHRHTPQHPDPREFLLLITLNDSSPAHLAQLPLKDVWQCASASSSKRRHPSQNNYQVKRVSVPLLESDE